MNTYKVRVGKLFVTVRAWDGHDAIKLAKQKVGNYTACIVEIKKAS